MSNATDSDKETITFMVNSEVCLSFRKKCLDNDQQYSEAITELMKEYINKK